MNRKKTIPDPGDIVLLDFPGVKQTKRRPALIVSSAFYHKHRPDVIVGLTTSQIDSATAATDYLLQDWAPAHLSRPSAFRTFLVTIPRSAITRGVGSLSDRDWVSVCQRLYLALGQSGESLV